MTILDVIFLFAGSYK